MSSREVELPALDQPEIPTTQNDGENSKGIGSAARMIACLQNMPHREVQGDNLLGLLKSIRN